MSLAIDSFNDIKSKSTGGRELLDYIGDTMLPTVALFTEIVEGDEALTWASGYVSAYAHITRMLDDEMQMNEPTLLMALLRSYANKVPSNGGEDD